MLKIQTTGKSLAETALKYCRIILTEDSSSTHRFVETKDGVLEYRMGAGKWKDIDARSLRTLVRSMVQAAKSHKVEFLAIDFSLLSFPKVAKLGEAWLASTVVENLLLAGYEFTKYKTKAESKTALKEILLCGISTSEAKAGAARGQIVGQYINQARDIANTTGGDMTPTAFGTAAKTLHKGLKIQTTVLGEKELKKLKMGALLAVGQGTKSETKLIIAEYWGAGKGTGKTIAKDKQPIVLIGKGITYDTGGLNVKPSGSMHDMHLDMSGGSSVLAAIAIAAKLGLKKNIVALVPSAENAISDDAMRAGDIVTSMSGQTIEVLHTDAEGRMVLADAMTYSERYQPKATLSYLYNSNKISFYAS